MKRILYLLLLFAPLQLLLSPLLMEAQTIYGWNLHNAKNPSAVGPCRFDVSRPNEVTILRQHDYGVCAGAFVGKKYYAYTYRSTSGASQPIAFGVYSFDTGVFQQIADYSRMQTLFYDMAYDYKNSSMYALGLSNGKSTLLRVDIATGAIVVLATLSQQFVSLAADLDGRLYAEDTYGYLTQLGVNGSETQIGGGDYSPMNIVQSMCFDHTSGSLYWAAPTAREGTQFLKLDKTSGYVSTNAEIQDEAQIVGMDIPFSSVKPGAPGEITNFSVEPAAMGVLKASLRMKAPAKTSSEGLLTTCKVQIYRSGEAIKVFDNVSPSAAITFEDVLSKDGVYTYKVLAANSVGQGEEVVRQVYVGEDLPAAVSNVVIEKVSRTACRIAWTAPSTGIHNGYIPTNVQYDIVRLPDDKEVAKGIGENTFTDKTALKLGNYRYRISPRTTKGQGASVESESIILGNAIETPYICNFSDDEFVFWQPIDANKDKTTWRRTMGNGVYCSYSSIRGDDWLISSPIKLDAGKRYKLIVTASSYSDEMPEKMGIHIGQGREVGDMKLLLADFIVKNPEGEKRDYVVYIPQDAGGEFNLGLHMHSDPDMYHLTVSRLELREAREGKVSGLVVYGGKPMEGAEILLKEIGRRTYSNSSGQWEMNAVAEGDYTLLVRKEGFAEVTKPIMINDGGDSPLRIDLQPLAKISVAGKICFDGGKPLADARVELYSPDDKGKMLYRALSGKNGSYTLSDVYEGHYRACFSRPGLKAQAIEVNLSKTAHQIATVELADKPIAPRVVVAKEDASSGLVLSWLKPIDVDTVSYYRGEGVARIGVEEATARSIVGTVFRKSMVLTKVQWMTSDHRGPHKKVDLVLFALDKDGEPTKQILFEAKDVANRDNEWSSYEFATPLPIVGGALVALRYNGYLSLLADGGVPAGLPFEKHVHLLSRDYESLPFEYLDKHNLEKNYLLSVEFASLDEQGKEVPTLQRTKGFKVYRQLVGAASSSPHWESVGETAAATASIVDQDWSKLPMGYYRYGVRAVFASNVLSDLAQSAPLGKDLDTHVLFDVATNAGLPTGNVLIELISKSNKRERYRAEANTSGRLEIAHLPKGEYSLEAKLDGFDPIRVAKLAFDKENEYVHKVSFVERLLPSYNVKVEATGTPFERRVVWNQDNYIFDDFESYPAFTLEPASSERNWVYWDLDKQPTIEFDQVRFPHMGEPMSFIAFNPSQTDPRMLMIEKASAAYGGEQYLAAFSNRKGSCRNYLFSPILTFSGDVRIAMQGRSLSNQFGAEVIGVGYTTMDYPKVEADIHWVEPKIVLPDNGWKRLEYSLPAEARRAVIAHLSEEAFFTMIDNLFVGEPSPYAEGLVTKPLVDRATYTVSLDGKDVATGLREHQFVFDNLSPGEHHLQVTAQYATGRVAGEPVAFFIEQKDHSTPVHPTMDNQAIRPNPANTLAMITIPLHTWQAFAVDGRMVDSGSEQAIDASRWPAGLYFVRIQKDGGTVVARLLVDHH